MAHSSSLRTLVSHRAFNISGFDRQLRCCILYLWFVGPLGVFVRFFARSIRRLFNQECCCIRLRCSVVEAAIRASCCHVRETHLSCSSALQPAGFHFFEWSRMCHILLVYERLLCSGSCPGHEVVCVTWQVLIVFLVRVSATGLYNHCRFGRCCTLGRGSCSRWLERSQLTRCLIVVPYGAGCVRFWYCTDDLMP